MNWFPVTDETTPDEAVVRYVREQVEQHLQHMNALDAQREKAREDRRPCT